MNVRKLRKLLEGLEHEIAETTVENPQLAKTLDSIAQQVEQSISEIDETSMDLDHETLRERAKEALEAFETTHPRLTSILSDLLIALSPNRM